MHRGAQSIAFVAHCHSVVNVLHEGGLRCPVTLFEATAYEVPSSGIRWFTAQYMSNDRKFAVFWWQRKSKPDVAFLAYRAVPFEG